MELTKEQQVLQQVINKAWENEAFKKDLIANPVETIAKLTGQEIKIPEGKTIVVRDQTDESTIYINIPAEQNLEDVELNEDQLEAVAGGAQMMGLYFRPQWELIDAPINPKLPPDIIKKLWS